MKFISIMERIASSSTVQRLMILEFDYIPTTLIDFVAVPSLHNNEETLLGLRSRNHDIWNKSLKAVDTIGNCQRLVFTVGVSQHTLNITNLCKFELLVAEAARYNARKNTLSHEGVCFQMLDFETSNFKSEVSKSNSWKITSLTMSLQRELFLTMFYTINLYPLLIIK